MRIRTTSRRLKLHHEEQSYINEDCTEDWNYIRMMGFTSWGLKLYQDDGIYIMRIGITSWGLELHHEVWNYIMIGISLWRSELHHEDWNYIMSMGITSRGLGLHHEAEKLQNTTYIKKIASWIKAIMVSRWPFDIAFIGEIAGKYYEKSNEHGPKPLWLVLFEQIALLWQAVLIKFTWK